MPSNFWSEIEEEGEMHSVMRDFVIVVSFGALSFSSSTGGP
jgi:hypothetical protein